MQRRGKSNEMKKLLEERMNRKKRERKELEKKRVQQLKLNSLKAFWVDDNGL